MHAGNTLIKTKPFAHQKEQYDLVKDREHYAFFWEMGTGKTKILIDIMMNWFDKKKKHWMLSGTTPEPSLIIAPKGVIHNWKKELLIHSHFDDRKICVLDGSSKKRIDDLKKGFPIYVINYEAIRIKDVAKQLLPMHWEFLILDEAHKIKNYKAQQTKMALSLAARANRRFIATGTPILNTMLDLFTLFKFLDGGQLLGTNFFYFRNQWFEDKNAGFRHQPWYFPNYKPKTNSEDGLNKLIYKIADRKLKEDCLDLPPKVYEQIYIEMTPEQKRVYKEIKDDLITQIDDDVAIAQTALTKILRLNQVTSGFIKAENSIKDIKHNKMKALKELVTDLVPSKIIIWAYFRKDIETITELFKDYGAVSVYGGTKNKQENVDKFQTDPACQVFVGQPASAGMGITLTKASYAIYYSQGYSMGDRQQSEDRCHRAGSEIHNKITYIDLVCRGTVDEIILKALRAKKDLAHNILDLFREIKGVAVSG